MRTSFAFSIAKGFFIEKWVHLKKHFSLSRIKFPIKCLDSQKKNLSVTTSCLHHSLWDSNYVRSVILSRTDKIRIGSRWKNWSQGRFFERTIYPCMFECVNGTHNKIVAPNILNQHLYYIRTEMLSLNFIISCILLMRIWDHRILRRFFKSPVCKFWHKSLI